MRFQGGMPQWTFHHQSLCYARWWRSQERRWRSASVGSTSGRCDRHWLYVLTTPNSRLPRLFLVALQWMNLTAGHGGVNMSRITRHRSGRGYDWINMSAFSIWFVIPWLLTAFVLRLNAIQVSVQDRRGGSGDMFNTFSAGTDFRRENLTSIDVRFWRLKSIPALKYFKNV